MTETVAAQLPAAQPLERALAEVMDARAPLKAQLARIGTIGVTEFPEDWLPWLVMHYGLDRIAPYVGDLLRTLVEGKEWQRVRGTPAATEDFVLRWLGLKGLSVPDGYGGAGAIEEGRVDDVKWWLYQIALAEAPEALPVVARLIGADDLSRAAGTKLGRIYGGYDIRALRWDGTRYDRTMYDDWSGVVLPEIGAPHLSFGTLQGCEVDAGISDPVVTIEIDRSLRCRFEGGLIYDRSRYDHERRDVAIVTIAAMHDSESIGQVELRGGAWPRSRWPGQPWTATDIQIYGGAD